MLYIKTGEQKKTIYDPSDNVKKTLQRVLKDDEMGRHISETAAG